jgi:predicted MFS family arabinose efflux permease
LLCAIALALGTCEVLFDNASQAILPSLVRSDELERGNGQLVSAQIITNAFLGLPLGAILFTWAIGLPFALNAFSFALASILVWSIPGRYRPLRAVNSSISADAREGLQWIWRDPVIRGLAAALGISNFGFNMGQAVFVLFALEQLGVSERGYGILLAVMALGAAVGGLAGDRVVTRVGRRQALLGALAVWALTQLSIGLFPSTVVVTVAVIIESIAATIWNVVSVSLRQQVIPDELLGRVNSIYRWVGWGTIPLGALTGGYLARSFGLRSPYLLSACMCAVAFVVARQALRGLRPVPTAHETPRTPAPPSIT